MWNDPTDDVATSASRKLIGYASGHYSPKFIYLTREEARAIVNALCHERVLVDD